MPLPDAPVDPGDPTEDWNRATGFKILRCDGTCSPTVTIATVSILSTSPDASEIGLTYEFQRYEDTKVAPGATYTYAVVAYNAFGETLPTTPATVTTSTWLPATGVTLAHEFTSPHAAPVKFTAQATYSVAAPVPAAQYRFFLDGVLAQDFSSTRTWSIPVGTTPGEHTVSVDVRTNLTLAAPDFTPPVSRTFTIIPAVGAPTDITLSSHLLLDVPPLGTTVGQPVGTFTTTDADPLVTFVYSLVPGAGSTDNALFRIAGDELQANAVLDYRGRRTFIVRVRSRQFGGAGLWVEEFFTINLAPSVVNDFDGDGRSDIGCYYPPGGNWYEFRSTDGFWSTVFGYAGTVPITGDFDGDARGDIGVYHAESGSWYIFKSREGFWQAQFGYAGTRPVAGDFDGDGRDDIGVYADATGKWSLWRSTEGQFDTVFGHAGTIPVVGDYDGDGRDDIGVYYPAGGSWSVFKSTEGQWDATFGYAGTIPIVGDFDGDGRDDIGVYLPARRHLVPLQEHRGVLGDDVRLRRHGTGGRGLRRRRPRRHRRLLPGRRRLVPLQEHRRVLAGAVRLLRDDPGGWHDQVITPAPARAEASRAVDSGGGGVPKGPRPFFAAAAADPKRTGWRP